MNRSRSTDGNRPHPRFPRALLAASLGLAFTLLNACGPSEPGSDAVEEAPEVDPNAPGVREVAPGVYEVVIIAHESAFQPREIRLPVGAEARFRMRSSDPTFVHSFLVQGTPLEVEMIGLAEWAEAVHTFDVAGEYPFVCYVYCGAGHASMMGRIIVE